MTYKKEDTVEWAHAEWLRNFSKLLKNPEDFGVVVDNEELMMDIDITSERNQKQLNQIADYLEDLLE